MNRYLKLVHYELTRFRWIYASLLVLTLLFQFGGIFLYSHSVTNNFNENMAREALAARDYVHTFGSVGFFDFTQGSIYFLAPIGLSMAALVLYVFLIWYRDWLGKNMFIYRLLMVPTSRSNVYLAKLSAIIFMVLGLIAFQLLLLPMQSSLLSSLIPSIFRDALSIYDVIAAHDILGIIIPRNIVEFFLYYGAGVMGVIVIFTAIIIERSYRWKGIIAGIAYGAVATMVFLLPIIISEIWLIDYFYPIEMVLMEIVTGLLVIGISLWLSFYLLKNKVYV